MKHHNLISLGAAVLAAGMAVVRVQARQEFDVQAYQTFLNSHASLSSQGLLDLHPAGSFKRDLSVDLSTVGYLDSIDARYHLTDGEKQLLARNGFVVSDRLSVGSFGRALDEAFHGDLPVFVSADAILHPVHMSYDLILMEVEDGLLIPTLGDLLERLHGRLPALESLYAGLEGMQYSLDDLDLYLTVARRLLGETAAPSRASNDGRVDTLLALIAAEQAASVNLFSGQPRLLDFSQFKVRGHYTASEALTQYFKAMIWLGRTEMQMLAPDGVVNGPPPEDIRRQSVDAFLVLEALDGAGADSLYTPIDSVIGMFVGESDNITVQNLRFLRSECSITHASDLLDSTVFGRLQSTIRENKFAVQRINSQILMTDPLNPAQLKPPAAFLLLGQRFVIDSYVTASVVYDRILWEGNKVWRQLPSSLDVLFALGNDAAAQLLQPEIDRYHYAPNLAALRYLVDSYDSAFWSSSMYNGWLDAIRTLRPPRDRSGLPSFMKTAAWWQEKMNTQLASWAQLRHDNLLYAKQSYTSGSICSYPYGYVEPVPAFYQAISRFAELGERKLAGLNFSGWAGIHLRGYFSHVRACMDILAGIAGKELEGTGLSTDEIGFLKSLIRAGGICGPEYDGWYPSLYLSRDDCATGNFVIADVHTAPTDEAGNLVGKVLHAATGPVNLAIVIAATCPGDTMAFVGPVMSYYEYVTLNFTRLSDEEWKSMIDNSLPPRPSWINLYLADSAGGERPPGPMLVTDSGDRPENPDVPVQFALEQNFPNPFNSTTVIRLTVRSTRSMPVEVVITDVAGRKIRNLLRESLPPGSYLLRWDGRSDGGGECASGVYFCTLRSAAARQTRTMLLIR